MIFVGDGALLWRAVRHAQQRGYAVDLVCTSGRVPRPDYARSLTVRETSDINLLTGDLRAASTDQVIWSIDNELIFRAPVLDGGYRIYNVHGGPLPAYRGLPLVMLAYAILNGETEFGATLHEVDAGLDTGPILAERRFPIAPDDTLEDAMMVLVETCQHVFEENLEPVLRGQLVTRENRVDSGQYYGWRALRELTVYREHPNYTRATDLGFFADFHPEMAAILAG